MNYKTISKFKEGESIKGFFLCNEKYLKNTRLGDAYLDIIISDLSGKIRCKIWKHVDYFNHRFEINNPIAVKGTIINYNNQLEVDVKFINSIKKDEYNDYGYDVDLIIPAINESANKMWTFIKNSINSLSNKHKLIINSIYMKNKSKLLIIPSFDKQYFFKKGYLKHLMVILELNESIYPKYTKLDKNKILSGILLKNIGCLDFFNDDLLFSISKEGKKFNIATLGAKILNDELYNFRKLDNGTKLFYQHIISNNHNSNDLESNYINLLFKFDKSMFINE